MDLEKVLSSALGGRGGSQSAIISALTPALGSLLAGGGLAKLLQGFQAKGLSRQADSWVSKGENKPISASDVHEVLGKEQIADFARQANISESEAAEALATVLPAAVDHVTPEGSIPASLEFDTAVAELDQGR